MKFDVYFAWKNQEGKVCPGIKPHPKSLSEICDLMKSGAVYGPVERLRQGDKEAKKELPAVTWMGTLTIKGGKRGLKGTVPTQLIMIDIDHSTVSNETVLAVLDRNLDVLHEQVAMVHRTCSGMGWRIIFKAFADCKTIEENLSKFDAIFKLGDLGGNLDVLKDYSRLSFLSISEDVLYLNKAMLDADSIEGPLTIAPENAVDCTAADAAVTVADKGEAQQGSVRPFSDDEREDFEVFEYRGIPIKTIVDKYVNWKGAPDKGEVHNFYNGMVKNFRNICNNNPRLLLYILPRFGHSEEECYSQIKSICKVNTLSSLPKDFYFFLKDNGFYKKEGEQSESLRNYMMQEDEDGNEIELPYLPPVIRDIVRTAPKDFVIPVINALMPILGTLTSYVQAIYPYDGRFHTTSFFSVIYAPPGTGKGFVERFLDMLFRDLKLRDLVQSERENIYLRIIQQKGANDKAPEQPHTSMRIIPPKNSEAEFLQKQKDNHGYHMFTYAAEMDSWAKGVKAAGGNKDDMIRIAWDNGEYGQQFKSANTFKGTVNLYWNVLITGTLQQVESYFKNVENGLVTRCCFSTIENQEFAAAPRWKVINARSMEIINDFIKRCDENTYETPCEVDPSLLTTISPDDFDKEIDWRFKFRDRKTVDLSWIMPTIDAFHKRHMEKAALDIDRARDVFRRRVGVRGFRLALMCECLYKTPRQKDRERCKDFIDWWMERDLEMMLKLWGARYNEQAEVVGRQFQRQVFEVLGPEFTKTDVYTACLRQGIKTPVRQIVYKWRQLGYIESTGKDNYKKKLKNEK